MGKIRNVDFNKQISERVDRFLRKEMDEEESVIFLEELKTNPELEEYYLRQFNLMRGIKLTNIMEVMKTEEKIIQRKHLVVDFVSRYKYVAALAAMLICGVFIWDGSVTRNVGEEMYSSVVYRGGDAIDQLVADGNYKEAIDMVDEELKQEISFVDATAADAYNQKMNDLKYRKALIYLRMGKKHAAKTILKELRKLGDNRSNEVLKKLLW
jgi:tetratricopeptide (TPR) repeat protein